MKVSNKELLCCKYCGKPIGDKFAKDKYSHLNGLISHPECYNIEIHELKIWEAYFREVKNGNKTFEVRLNDRNFKVGDFLLLKEYDPDIERYSGNEILCKVTYILDSPIYLKSGYIIMAGH